MIGFGPPAVYVLAQSSAVSYAARATPTAAMPATGPDHAKLRLMTRSPLPRAPSSRFAAGTRALSNTTSALAARRWPSLSMNLYVTPGVPRSTTLADSPSVPPLVGSVRTITVLAFTPCASHPGLDGQYLRPLSTYVSPSRSAITPIPYGRGSGTSKFAVPPGVPAGSLAVHPARYSPAGSEVAARRKRSFCSSDPYHQTGINPSPLHSTVHAKPGSTTQISSAARTRSTFDMPPPPYSLGRKQKAKPRLYAST